jgi:NADH:ubiquinone oxidoreductase subunit E
MKIAICIGSSCHIKGSQEVIELFQKSIIENNLEGKVDLVGTFCMGECSNQGVSVKFDDGEVVGITRENFYKIFFEKVVQRVK